MKSLKDRYKDALGEGLEPLNGLRWVNGNPFWVEQLTLGGRGFKNYRPKRGQVDVVEVLPSRGSVIETLRSARIFVGSYVGRWELEVAMAERWERS